MPHQLEALIFDVDGTLAETEDAHRQAFNRVFAEKGHDRQWDRDHYRELLKVTGGKERIRHDIERHAPHLGQGVDLDARIRELHAAKSDVYQQMVASGALGLRPGIERLIAEARRAGLRLAIATTTTYGNITALINAALGPEAMSWFEVVGAGDAVPAKKPAPDVYLWVLERLKLEPGACLALEDSINGLRASRAAGIPTVVTPSLYTDHEVFDGALAVVPDLADVSLERLRELHAQAR